MPTFPKDFLWGAATSSYQIEGATEEGGRSPSIWDTFCRVDGAVVKGENGDVACDHYHRFPQDVAMMKDLGLQAYRFSIAWPRILPNGVENEAGLDFYDRLVDTLLEAGIQPWATLYHWDLPQRLEDGGGWPDRGLVKHFVDYADVVSKRLGDRVKHWITHNEPWCAAILGYQTGEHAPGRKDWSAALAASHHILLSHGAAVPAIRANSEGAEVGITLNFCPAEPASHSLLDADATRHFDGFFNRWFLDPICGRGYPEDMLRDYFDKGRLDAVRPSWLHDGDEDTIAVDTDFLGINYYSRAVIRGDEEGNIPQTMFARPEVTDMGWEVRPDALRNLLLRLGKAYDGPLVITENGCAYPTEPRNGQVADVRRTAYFEGHLRACHEAIAEGAELVGYFAWSLMDNFEWAWGYDKRFGLVWVDYKTQERIVKDSAHWYAQVISDNGW